MSLSGKRARAIRHRLAQAQHFLCCYCKRRFGKKGTPLGATIEHLKPKSRGGSNRKKTLAAACQHCNQHRGRQMQLAKARKEKGG